jgi:hypothetical protein
LSPDQGRRRAAEIVGRALLQRNEIIASANAEGEMIRPAARAEADDEIAFAEYRAEAFVGAVALVMDGHIRSEKGASDKLIVRSHPSVAAYSSCFAPMEHDPEKPPRGLFAALRTAGLWRQVGLLAERAWALLRREAEVADRERAVEARERQADVKYAEAERLLEDAAGAGDRRAAAELAASRHRRHRAAAQAR